MVMTKELSAKLVSLMAESVEAGKTKMIKGLEKRSEKRFLALRELESLLKQAITCSSNYFNQRVESVVHNAVLVDNNFKEEYRDALSVLLASPYIDEYLSLKINRRMKDLPMSEQRRIYLHEVNRLFKSIGISAPKRLEFLDKYSKGLDSLVAEKS